MHEDEQQGQGRARAGRAGGQPATGGLTSGQSVNLACDTAQKEKKVFLYVAGQNDLQHWISPPMLIIALFPI